MSLTGLPLILLEAFCTVAAVAATMLWWNRFGRQRYLLRTTGVLLAEVLLLVNIALVVNRSEQFYPTWATLTDTTATDETVVAAASDGANRIGPGDLDHRLAVRANGRTGVAQSFPWESADWRGWRLAAVPTVITPPGYLQHPTWSYSVVVVIHDGAAGWSAAAQQAAAARATASGISAVVVFATTTAATSAQALASALPDQLGRDLRITSHRWAIVTSAADPALAQSVVLAASARYPSIAVVAAGTQDGVAGQRDGRGDPVTTATGMVLPAGVATAVVVSNSVAVHQPGIETLPSTAPDALYTALSWAIERTPPPLAASVPLIRGRSGNSASRPRDGHGGSSSPSPFPSR